MTMMTSRLLLGLSFVRVSSSLGLSVNGVYGLSLIRALGPYLMVLVDLSLVPLRFETCLVSTFIIKEREH